MHLALLHAATRDRLLDGDDDDIADAGILAARAAQHLDALDSTGAGIVGDLEVGSHLDHVCLPCAFKPSRLRPELPSSWSWTAAGTRGSSRSRRPCPCS